MSEEQEARLWRAYAEWINDQAESGYIHAATFEEFKKNRPDNPEPVNDTEAT